MQCRTRPAGDASGSLASRQVDQSGVGANKWPAKACRAGAVGPLRTGLQTAARGQHRATMPQPVRHSHRRTTGVHDARHPGGWRAGRGLLRPGSGADPSRLSSLWPATGRATARTRTARAFVHGVQRPQVPCDGRPRQHRMPGEPVGRHRQLLAGWVNLQSSLEADLGKQRPRRGAAASWRSCELTIPEVERTAAFVPPTIHF